MDLRCDKCKKVKPPHELHKWNLDGEIICRDCWRELEADSQYCKAHDC